MSTTYRPSLHAAINNELVTRISALECPNQISTTRTTPIAPSTSGFVLLTEDQQNQTSRPASVIASCVSEAWEAARGCDAISKRRSSRWEVLVVFDRLVFTDRALELLMTPLLSSAPGLGGCVMRLVTVDYTYRPQVTPEQGTALRLTIEVLSNT